MQCKTNAFRTSYNINLDANRHEEIEKNPN